MQKSLKDSYRLISTSLPGYGGSEEIRKPSTNNMSLMSDFVANIVEQIGEPVHLIAHSFGGLTAFASILSETVTPLSLVTFEANPIYSHHKNIPFDWIDEIADLTNRFETAYAEGDPNAAKIIIDFWSKGGAFDAMPEAFQNYCRSSVYSNILDWRSAKGFTPYISDYSMIDFLCTLVSGEHANQTIKDISDELSHVIMDTAPIVVAGAGHFLISTHPEQCATIIDDHMKNYA